MFILSGFGLKGMMKTQTSTSVLFCRISQSLILNCNSAFWAKVMKNKGFFNITLEMALLRHRT